MYGPGFRFVVVLSLGIGIGLFVGGGGYSLGDIAGGGEDVLGDTSSAHIGGVFGDVSIHESGTQISLYVAEEGVSRAAVEAPDGWSSYKYLASNTGTIRFNRRGGFHAGNYTIIAEGSDFNTLQKETVYLKPPNG